MNAHASLFALLSVLAGAASAESSLTIFGRVDLSVRYLKYADAHQTQVAPDGNTTSRLGFRGIEDIADGLRAGFHLESSVVPDTGNFSANGKFWNRRSTVSLYTRYGELRLGRDVLLTWLPFVEGDVFGVSGVGDGSKTYRPLGRADTRVFSDNLISYLLPGNPWGIYGTISSAPSEGLAGRRYAGARLGYRKGAVDFSVAYSETSVETGTYKLAITSGSYDFKWAKIYAVAQKTELLKEANVHVDLGLAVPVPVIGGTVKVSYARVDGQGALETADAEQYALGYVYDLSKRTALYTTVSVINNKGTANFTVGDITVASPTNTAVALPLPAGTKSQGAEAGVRHTF
jgi:predicted porin